jgi:hypothetical protein
LICCRCAVCHQEAVRGERPLPLPNRPIYTALPHSNILMRYEPDPRTSLTLFLAGQGDSHGWEQDFKVNSSECCCGCGRGRLLRCHLLLLGANVGFYRECQPYTQGCGGGILGSSIVRCSAWRPEAAPQPFIILCIFVVALLASFPLLVPPPPFPSAYHAGSLCTVRLTAASLPHSGTRQRQQTASPRSEATCSSPLCGQSSLGNGSAGGVHGRGLRL